MQRKCSDENQEVTWSTTGAVVTSWKFSGIDVFYPQTMLEIGGISKLRGGMHPCWPNFGPADPKFGLPQHGVLRNREADVSDGNSASFYGPDLLGSAYRVESEVQVAITLQPNGFRYTLMARLTEASATDVFVNGGLHPYFCTPNGRARVSTIHAETWVKDPSMPAEYRLINRCAEVSIPGVGIVQTVVGGAWQEQCRQKVGLWRDSRKSLCVEPVLGTPATYGEPPCPKLSMEWLVISCDFGVKIN